jgi:hypothetical protein
MLSPPSDVGVGSQMEREILTVRRATEGCDVEHVSPHGANGRMASNLIQNSGWPVEKL